MPESAARDRLTAARAKDLQPVETELSELEWQHAPELSSSSSPRAIPLDGASPIWRLENDRPDARSRRVEIVREDRLTHPPREELAASAPPVESTQFGGGIHAPYPMHTVLMDLTEIPSLLGLFRFRLAVVLDAFSRMPLAARVFPAEPNARELAGLLARACERFGPARYLITDHGSQFTAGLFRSAVHGFGIQHRFGAIGQSGSIALIERFWRTIKHQLRARFLPPLTLALCTRGSSPS